MQPTYLPYLGYFHLIAASDVFVFLDDVQFARRSWQSRNRILGAGGEVMLTVPVQKHERDTPICEILISEAEPWRDKHLASIRHAYARRPFFAEGFAFLEEALATRGELAGLNRGVVEAAARRLDFKAEFVNASDLACPGHRSEHLLAICRAVGATDYLSPMGSQDYMMEDGVFTAVLDDAGEQRARRYRHEVLPHRSSRTGDEASSSIPARAARIRTASGKLTRS